MARYIDADALIYKIRGIVPSSQDVDFIIRLIEAQPTAFDLDKVVQELEERIEQTFCESLSRNGNNRDAGIRNNAYHNALEIVRNGGKE
jgi:hypothetical protein